MPKKAANPNQLGLFGEPNTSIDDAVSQVEAEQKDKKVNLGINTKEQQTPYGIRKSYLTGTDYNALKNIFYGMNQFRVSDAIVTSMNPVEILALYCGIQLCKERRIQIDAKLPFDEVISKLVSKAMDYSKNLAFQHYRSDKLYPVKKNDMKKRMAALDEDVKNMFLSSLREPRKYSNAE